MRYLSLFSGIEAASVAWKPLGWTCVGVAEIEPFPCAVLKHHYPDVPNLGSVLGITGEMIAALGPIDLVVGGSPCQDLSVAGKRAGLVGERSSLFHQQIRIFHAARLLCGARWLVWENVPGAFSSHAGADFAAVVGAMAGCSVVVPAKRWGTEGVALGKHGLVEWCVLDAQWFGVAQRRRRVFAVLDTGDWPNRPPILLERESLRGDSAPSREAGKVASTIPARSAAGRGIRTDCDGGLITSTGEVSHCLNAGGMGRQDYETETLIAHTLRGEGFDASEPTCAVDGCMTKPHAAGFCRSHYARFKRHGDPLAGRVAEGEPKAFLMAHVAHTGGDCVQWPYARLASGYGSIEHDGKTHRAHRLMCELAHGKSPSDGLDAAHSCGSRACINPKHLRWSGRSENMADTVLHGTAPRGERHGASKLTENDVRTISARLDAGETHQAIADAFGVSRNAISDIAQGKNWAWLREDGTGRGTPLVAVPVAFDTTQMSSAANYSNPKPGDPCHPLAAGAHPPAIAFMADDYKDGSYEECDAARPLTTSAGRTRAAPIALSVSLRGRDGGGTAEIGGEVQNCLRASGGGGDKPHVLAAMQVRRLTVKECSRLQGFPDDYLSQVPWRGKPHPPDGPMYKALGNSMAVPVMRWIGRQITKARLI